MYDKNLIVATDGNISFKVSDKEIWITPSGVSKGFMTPQGLICVDINGNKICGSSKASSEIKLHLNIYKKLDWVNAVIHAHPTFCSIFAVCNKPLDKKYLTEAVVSLGDVPVTQFALPSTDELALSCDPYLKDYKALLLANHGAVVWDKTLESALYKLETLEHTARISFFADIAGATQLSERQTQQLIELRKIYGGA
jgi:L-fuculose-phosphate aldolase